MADKGVRLLIVDDDPSIRYSLCQIFSCSGHDVRSAEDGLSALRQIGEAAPDILLSDLNMPRMSGFELLSIVRQRFPAIYVIAMSGGYLEEGVPDGVAADSYHAKATGVADLLNSVGVGTGTDRASLQAARKMSPICVSQGSCNLSTQALAVFAD